MSTCNVSTTLHTHSATEVEPYASWRDVLLYRRSYGTALFLGDFVMVRNAQFMFRNPRVETNKFGVIWNSNSTRVPKHLSMVHVFSYWSRPTLVERSMVCAEAPHPHVYVMYGFHNGNYGHFLHDHLPVIAWLREVMPPTAKLVLPRSKLHREILWLADRAFATKRVIWYDWSTPGCATQAHLFVPPFEDDVWRHKSLVHLLRDWVRPPLQIGFWTAKAPEALAIFYSRLQTPTIRHGRFMVPEHEKAVLDLIRFKIKSELKGFRTRLEVYNGHLADGHTMPIAQQAALFESASFVIGPHGSGLANIVWLPNLMPHLRSTPSGKAPRARCASRPRILEFNCGTRSADVQKPGCPYGPTYWGFYALAPWAEYHHLLFAENSTSKATWVHFDELAEALDSIFRQTF